MGVMKPDLVMRNIIPVIMAGVLGIYGLIVAVILQGSITQPTTGTDGMTKVCISSTSPLYVIQILVIPFLVSRP